MNYGSFALLHLALWLCWLTGCTPDLTEERATFASFDGTHIAYTEVGNGPPVVLIHGFISDGSSWEQTALKQQLIESGYQVIVPDLRGNGASDQPKDPQRYADDAEVKDLRALADHLELGNYAAVGYSRGAIVLAKLLTQEPRISRGVLGGMGLDFTNPQWDRRRMFAEAFGGTQPLNEVTRGAVEYAKSVGANLHILSYLQQFQPVTSVAELRQVQTPVLVVAGDADRDNGEPAALQQALPHSELEIVPGDHNQTYKTEAFATAVLRFLEE